MGMGSGQVSPQGGKGSAGSASPSRTPQTSMGGKGLGPAAINPTNALTVAPGFPGSGGMPPQGGMGGKGVGQAPQGMMPIRRPLPMPPFGGVFQDQTGMPVIGNPFPPGTGGPGMLVRQPLPMPPQDMDPRQMRDYQKNYMKGMRDYEKDMRKGNYPLPQMPQYARPYVMPQPDLFIDRPLVHQPGPGFAPPGQMDTSRDAYNRFMATANFMGQPPTYEQWVQNTQAQTRPQLPPVDYSRVAAELPFQRILNPQTLPPPDLSNLGGLAALGKGMFGGMG